MSNIKKVVCMTKPGFFNFVNFKSFFEASGKPNILLSTTFAAVYQINNTSTVTLQNSLNFIFLLGNKDIKVSRNC